MSKTRQGGRKTGDDFYPTPEWAIRRFLERWSPYGDVTNWVEPAVGTGNIVRVVNEHIPNVTWDAFDIRPYNHTGLGIRADSVEDYLSHNMVVDGARSEGVQWDVCITNPPFRLAMDFIQRGLSEARFVVMLLRLNFLGSTKRNKFFRGNMPDIYVVPNRVSFTLNGKTDSCEVGWFVWDSKANVSTSRICVLDNTSLAERKADRPLILESVEDVGEDVGDAAE